MRRSPALLLSIALLLTGFVSGCASTSFTTMEIIREADDAPDHFLVGLPSSTETMEPSAGDGCRSPMVDPRDETRLTLVRSGSDLGDYEVPLGHYGIGRGELLRLECSTGRAIGVVRR